MPRAASPQTKSVMVGLAANHGSQADHTAVQPRAGAVLGGQRQLKRTGHLMHIDRLRVLAVAGELLTGAVDQALGQVLVEIPDADRVPVSRPRRAPLWRRPRLRLRPPPRPGPPH